MAKTELQELWEEMGRLRRRIAVMETRESIGGGVSDHGALSGLADDDHSQYAKLAGRSGGQTLIGGTDGGDDLTLESTGHATKGDVLLQPNGGYVGVGTSAPAMPLDVVGGAIRSRIGSAGGTFIQGILDVDNGYTRSFLGHNASWNFSTNLWNTQNIGANDATGIVIPVGGGFAFIQHSSAGAVARTFTHAEFMGGEKVRITTDGKVGIGTTAPSSHLEIQAANAALKLNSTSSHPVLYFTENGTNQWHLTYSVTGDYFTIVESGVAERLNIADGGTFTFNGNFGAWTTLSLTANWSTNPASGGALRYRKVGDRVELRGSVAQSTGAGNTIATLPSGFRPTGTSVLFFTSQGLNVAYSYTVTISTAGVISISTPAAGGIITFEGWSFSIL